MANKTDAKALATHGTDPQSLLPSTLRHRIHLTPFWNTTCFALTTADLVEHATQLTHLPSPTAASAPLPPPFLCLLLKLLQQAPDDPVIALFLSQPHFKYARALAALYVRLAVRPGAAARVYALLEPLLADPRKLVAATDDGCFCLTYVDVFVHELLNASQVFGIALPRLPLRHVLVDTGALAPRKSALPKDDLVALGLA